MMTESVQKFVNSYRNDADAQGVLKRHRDANGHEDPDFIAAQGYEAVKVLADAYTWRASVVPTEAASGLRLYGEFDGITGKISFDKNGDVKNKMIFLKVYGGKADEGPGAQHVGCGRQGG
jgi:branched-chain amino acid transport system substrate-binding protein